MGTKAIHPMVEIPRSVIRKSEEAILSLVYGMMSLPTERICDEYLNMSEFLWRHGLFFDKVIHFSKSNYRFHKGTPKKCFRNCVLMRKKIGPSVTYVEGFAIFKELGIPMHHAWCVNSDGYVIDPTWDCEGRAYFGVPIGAAVMDHLNNVTGDHYLVQNTMNRTGCANFLDDWTNGWPLICRAKKILTESSFLSESFVNAFDVSIVHFEEWRERTYEKMQKWQQRKHLKADELTVKGK